MQFKGSVPIDAPRERVWAFLMDPQQVGSCGPGVASIEVIDADHFKAVAKVGVGLAGMRERVRQLGGQFEIASSDRGTTVRARVPMVAGTSDDHANPDRG